MFVIVVTEDILNIIYLIPSSVCLNSILNNFKSL